MFWLVRPDAIAAFEDKGVQKALRRYVDAADNRKLAKFLLCRSIPIGVNLKSADEELLWELHDEAIKNFNQVVKKFDASNADIDALKFQEPSFLDLKIELANRILKSCRFCERRCGANRAEGKRGFCNLGKETRLSSEFIHLGEEACLVPSHTFFFIGCTFYCVFCQNWSISRQFEKGEEITPGELAELARKRRLSDGSRNINLVGGEPTPNLHTILAMLKELDTSVPVVWNSNMYMSTEVMKLLNGVVDVYLADFKYGSNACAERLSKVKNYFEVVARNHLLAKQHAELLIRHLVLPSHVECCTRGVLEWIGKNLGNEVRVNIMAQYRPEFEAKKYLDIARRPTSEEMRRALELAKENGLWNLD